MKSLPLELYREIAGHLDDESISALVLAFRRHQISDGRLLKRRRLQSPWHHDAAVVFENLLLDGMLHIDAETLTKSELFMADDKLSVSINVCDTPLLLIVSKLLIGKVFVFCTPPFKTKWCCGVPESITRLALSNIRLGREFAMPPCLLDLEVFNCELRCRLPNNITKIVASSSVLTLLPASLEVLVAEASPLTFDSCPTGLIHLQLQSVVCDQLIIHEIITKNIHHLRCLEIDSWSISQRSPSHDDLLRILPPYNHGLQSLRINLTVLVDPNSLDSGDLDLSTIRDPLMAVALKALTKLTIFVDVNDVNITGVFPNLLFLKLTPTSSSITYSVKLRHTKLRCCVIEEASCVSVACNQLCRVEAWGCKKLMNALWLAHQSIMLSCVGKTRGRLRVGYVHSISDVNFKTSEFAYNGYLHSDSGQTNYYGSVTNCSIDARKIRLVCGTIIGLKVINCENLELEMFSGRDKSMQEMHDLFPSTLKKLSYTEHNPWNHALLYHLAHLNQLKELTLRQVKCPPGMIIPLTVDKLQLELVSTTILRLSPNRIKHINLLNCNIQWVLYKHLHLSQLKWLISKLGKVNIDRQYFPCSCTVVVDERII